MHRADSTSNLTYFRSNGDLRLSGRASTTSKTRGPNTSSWQSSTGCHCLPLTRYPQKSRADRATTSARRGTLAAQSRTLTTSQCRWASVACRSNRTARRVCRPRIQPSRSHRLPPQSLPTHPHLHFSEDAQRHWLRLPPARAMPHKPIWLPKS